MTTTTLLSVLKALVFPPGSIATLLVVAAIIGRWNPRMGISVMVVGCLLFIILCMPRVSLWLSEPVEHIMPAPASEWRQAQAIVVLGGGRAAALPGRAPERINLDTFGRVAEAARIARATELPILLTGGRPGNEERSEAQLMAETLEHNFGLNAHWLENDSRNTGENADFSAAILRQQGIHTIVLVTTAFHMARGERHFTRLGFTVIPAPISFSSTPPGILGWLPSSLGLAQSQRALHEYIGWWMGR